MDRSDSARNLTNLITPNKKAISYILSAVFTLLNVVHLPWLLYVVYLLLAGLDFGTHLEMLVLFPWILIQLPSMLAVAVEIGFLIWARKGLRYCKVNLVLFSFYLLQIIAFDLCVFFG